MIEQSRTAVSPATSHDSVPQSIGRTWLHVRLAGWMRLQYTDGGHASTLPRLSSPVEHRELSLRSLLLSTLLAVRTSGPLRERDRSRASPFARTRASDLSETVVFGFSSVPRPPADRKKAPTQTQPGLGQGTLTGLALRMEKIRRAVPRTRGAGKSWLIGGGGDGRED